MVSAAELQFKGYSLDAASGAVLPAVSAVVGARICVLHVPGAAVRVAPVSVAPVFPSLPFRALLSPCVCM